MADLKIIHTKDAEFSRQWRDFRAKLSLKGALLEDSDRLDQVRRIVQLVKDQGDAAVAQLTAQYDKVELKPADFKIPPSVLEQAHRQMDPELLSALRLAIQNVKDYQRKIKISPPADWTSEGVRLGLRYSPLRRVGICVPGASAPLVSTVIMTVVPAQIAAVPEIAVVSAPSFQGSIQPAILGLCHELGLTEVYRVSGAQAVAALALGTESIPRVDKIVGPGNWWVQLAKKEVFGLVDIDSFAGPSEVLILADDSASPAWVAADMLSQAEHAPGSALLLTDSRELASAVGREVQGQLTGLSRLRQTRSCVEEYCLAVVTADMDEAITLANDFAAEHLQIQCQDSEQVAKRITNAGAIFVGSYSPVATGDYFAGPSHTLPTGGSARFFSPLCVNDFLRHSSIISYEKSAMEKAAKAIATIAHAEHLPAHARSVEIRRKK